VALATEEFQEIAADLAAAELGSSHRAGCGGRARLEYRDIHKVRTRTGTDNPIRKG
jgi:hypothetical protein